MKGFEYIDRIAPADCAFKAYGQSLAELFSHAALAVVSCMVEPESVSRTVAHQLNLQADNLRDLLYDWLEEIIFLKDSARVFLVEYDIKIDEIDHPTLAGQARGEKIDYGKQKILTDVKAVTLHRFSLERNKTGWEAFVILDL